MLEGVCFGMLDGYREFGEQKAAPQLELVGGGARSEGWASLMASVLQLPLGLDRGHQAAGAIGAARLGMLAAGVSIEEIKAMSLRPGRMVEPDASLTQQLADRYARFTALYPNLLEFYRSTGV